MIVAHGASRDRGPRRIGIGKDTRHAGVAAAEVWCAHLCAVSAASARPSARNRVRRPTVTAKGADISLTAGDGGDVVLVSDAGSVTADGLIASAAETATALEARLADVALLSADVAKVGPID